VSAVDLYALAAAGLFALGIGGAFLLREVIRRILALNIAGLGVFLLLVTLGARSEVVDPVPHALVLTGIVVTVSATAFALTLLRRINADHGTDDTGDQGLERLPEDEGEARS
jgi:multicomponent Na+:H+ antiporter subunit C